MQKTHSARARRRRVGVVGAIGLVLSAAMALNAWAAAPRVSQAVDNNGYPNFYQDAIGTRVEMCTDAVKCLPFDGEEGFWWSAEAEIGSKGLLVLAKEAALGEAGAPISFGRIRVRLFGLKPHTTYKVTHPYGVLNLRTDNLGDAREQTDIVAGSARPARVGDFGCIADGPNSQCNFAKALGSPVSQAYLRWDPRVGTKAPRGFLGNVARLHKVVGSPKGTNYFKVENARTGRLVDMTRVFNLGGQIAAPDRVRPAAPAAPNLEAKSDTGVRNDNVTTDRTPVISGMAEDASVVKLFVDGKQRARQIADNANYKFTPKLATKGRHVIKVTATDFARNVSRMSAALRMRIQ